MKLCKKKSFWNIFYNSCCSWCINQDSHLLFFQWHYNNLSCYSCMNWWWCESICLSSSAFTLLKGELSSYAIWFAFTELSISDKLECICMSVPPLFPTLTTHSQFTPYHLTLIIWFVVADTVTFWSTISQVSLIAWLFMQFLTHKRVNNWYSTWKKYIFILLIQTSL